MKPQTQNNEWINKVLTEAWGFDSITLEKLAYRLMAQANDKSISPKL
jgi:hypothetical protein